MGSKKIRRLTMSGVIAAVIAALTAYVRIPIPGGYAHPGDIGIALAGAFLGPFAGVPAAIGGGLADILGYPQYTCFTVLIKGLMGVCAGLGLGGKTSRKRVFFWTLLADVVSFGGYFLADAVLGGWVMAVADVPWNLTQAALFSVACALLSAYGKKRF